MFIYVTHLRAVARVFVLALDGMPVEVFERLRDSLPNIAEVASRGRGGHAGGGSAYYGACLGFHVYWAGSGGVGDLWV